MMASCCLSIYALPLHCACATHRHVDVRQLQQAMAEQGLASSTELRGRSVCCAVLDVEQMNMNRGGRSPFLFSLLHW